MVNALKKASNALTERLEDFFDRWGRFVSRHPYPVICSTIVLVAISVTGFLKFRIENSANLLWINSDSLYNVNEKWLSENFQKNERQQVVIVEGDNVLSSQSINKMFDFHERIESMISNGKTFTDICASIPIADIFQTKRRKRRQAENYDYDYANIWGSEYYDYQEEEEGEEEGSVSRQRINWEKYGDQQGRNQSKTEEDILKEIPDNIYCDLVTTLREKCLQTSLLEMWRYEEDIVRSTTREEILQGVNKLVKSPWYGHATDFTKLLGGVERNDRGEVTAARTALMVWTLRVPDDVELDLSQGGGLELEPADKTTIDWEQQFIDLALNFSSDHIKFVPNAVKSFSDVRDVAFHSETVFFDAYLMLLGYCAMFLYTVIMLGRFTMLDLRLYLSLAGIISVFLGLIVSVSVASVLGFPYTTIHAVLPFLCLAIGIDDMFVIMSCLHQVSGEVSVEARVGQALRHAGTSITVTTATDVVAFSVGAVTQMPGLQSFCVCTAIGLASIYLLQLSWFTAWLALDERRREAARNSLLPCLTHSQPPSQSAAVSKGLRSPLARLRLFSLYERLTRSLLYKVLVLTVAAGLLSCGVLGWSRIVHKFDPTLLLPAESYLREWLDLNSEYYDSFWSGEIYSGPLTEEDLLSVERLVTGLEDILRQGSVISSYDCWWEPFQSYVAARHNYTTETLQTSDQFPGLLSQFLFSPEGAKYKSDFQLAAPLTCGLPAPPILASRCHIDFLQFSGPETHIPAKAEITEMIRAAASPYFFSHSKVYSAWETDEIIGQELMRNLLLSLLCVAVITLLLLGDFFVCIIVLVMVIITLVDIVGFLHFWGLTIDILSAVNIVLAIGLCVDYAVHIAHAYLRSEGSREQRSCRAVTYIGGAVSNGGLTTFLALFFCSFSSAHVFQTFFKVFSLTVIFGLFHGLVLLPTALSIIGPSSSSSSSPSSSSESSSINTNSTTSVSSDRGKVEALSRVEIS